MRDLKQWAGIVALVVLYLISAGLQDAPGQGVQDDFQGCRTGDLCYFEGLPPVHIIGIEAPSFEDSEPYALDARNAAQAMIRDAAHVDVEIFRECRRYVIAEIFIDGRRLNNWMVRHGYARAEPVPCEQF